MGPSVRAWPAAAMPGAPPQLYFFTDPQRTPEPLRVAARLPPGAAIVYRHFGAPDRLQAARRLRRLAERRGLRLLIGADAALAIKVGADGVHLPERLGWRAAEIRRRFGGFIVTVAAHSPAALRRAAAAHAAILSPVFPSASPSAGAPIGLRRASRWVKAAQLPVIALGGVTEADFDGLARAGFHGAAGIDLFCG